MPNTIIKKIVVFFIQNMFGKHLNDDDDFTFIFYIFIIIITTLLSYILHIFYFYFIHFMSNLFIKVNILIKSN
jgi:hypothetical protein